MRMSRRRGKLVGEGKVVTGLNSYRFYYVEETAFVSAVGNGCGGKADSVVLLCKSRAFIAIVVVYHSN